MIEEIRQALIEGERIGSRYGLADPRSTSSLSAGLRAGNLSGSSLEFREHRDYQPGDDLRLIDWNAFARSDKLIVKQHREEISPHLDIVIDGSKSMALGETAKMRATLILSSVFATAAANSGYSHKAWLLRDSREPIANGDVSPAGWDNIDFDFKGEPSSALTGFGPGFRRRGMRVLISDLLWMTEPQTLLQHFTQEASRVAVIQVLAESDVNPPERGRIRLVDSETGLSRELFIDDDAIGRYNDALHRHRQNWHGACRQYGAVMIDFVAEHLVANLDLGELIRVEILKI